MVFQVLQVAVMVLQVMYRCSDGTPGTVSGSDGTPGTAGGSDGIPGTVGGSDGTPGNVQVQ